MAYKLRHITEMTDELLDQFIGYHNSPYSLGTKGKEKSWYRGVLKGFLSKSTTHLKVYGLFNGKYLLGFAIVSNVPSLYCDQYYHVDVSAKNLGVYISPEYRNQGVGKTLVDQLIKMLGNVPLIWLTDPNNFASKHLATACGFVNERNVYKQYGSIYGTLPDKTGDGVTILNLFVKRVST